MEKGKMEKGKIDKNLNIEENSFSQTTKVVGVDLPVIKKPAGHYLYFRKKPVVIEAVRVKEILGYWDQWSKLPEWVRSNYDTGKLLSKETGIELGVKTLEGYLTAGYNDWIIKGVKGEIYPIEEAIFLETYEPVSL